MKIDGNVRANEQLCNAYIKDKSVEKIEEFLRSSSVGDLIHHKVINMYIEMGSTEQALNHYNGIRSARPNFKLPLNGTARLAHAMFREEREWSEIIRLFIDNKQPPLMSHNVNEVHHLLQTVARTGNAAELNELFELLVANNFVVKDNRTAGFLVKVHLINKDLADAVHTFEKQFEEGKFISNRVPLMKALIVANDMDKLQIVFELVQAKHSYATAILTLVASFIQIGDIGLARVLLEHNMLYISDREFERYLKVNNNADEYPVLEGLLKATAGLEYDRRSIYSYLMTRFCTENKTNEALELWRNLRELHDEPTTGFLQCLATHLEEKGLRVPFEVPAPRLPMVPSHLSPRGLVEMNAALRNGNVNDALSSWNKIDPNSTQSIYLASDLVLLLSKNNRYAEAIDVAVQSIKIDRAVSERALLDLIQRLANDCGTQSLERLGDALPRSVKRSIKFGCELLNAYEKDGKWNDFFQKTLKRKSDNKHINDRILMSRLLALLQSQSISLADCEYTFYFLPIANAFHLSSNHFQLQSSQTKRPS